MEHQKKRKPTRKLNKNLYTFKLKPNFCINFKIEKPIKERIMKKIFDQRNWTLQRI